MQLRGNGLNETRKLIITNNFIVRHLIFLFIISLLFISCKKNDSSTPYTIAQKNNNGVSSAVINGQKYNSDITSASYDPDYPGKISISMGIYENGIQRKLISLYCINPQKAVQTIYSHYATDGKQRNGDSCLASFFLTQDDVIENSYSILESESDNQVTVTSYDASRKNLSGNFSMTLVRKKQGGSQQTQGYGDTLRITNGAFDTEVK